MSERLELRLRFFLYFGLIAVGALASIGWAGWFIGRRIDPALMADLVLAGVVMFFTTVGLTLWVWMQFDEQVGRPIITLIAEIRACVHAGTDHHWNPRTARYLGILAPTLKELISALHEARQEREQAVREATAEAEREKRNLEAVLQDLQEGVVICSLQHRVMLYNRQALEIFRSPENLGLGRSFLSFVNPQPLRHALDRLMARFNADRHIEHREGLTTLIVCPTANAHQQLRIHMALLLNPEQTRPTGYVVAFNDFTDELAAGVWRDRLLQDVTTDLRQRITHMTLAAEVLCHSTPPPPETVEALRPVIRAELTAVSERLQRLDEAANDLLAGAWPMSEVFSPVLLQLARDRRSENREMDVEIEGDPLWLQCDSASIAELLDRLLNRVAVWASVELFRLYASRVGGHAYLDIVWIGNPVPNTVLTVWLAERLDEGLGPVTVQDVLSRHKTDLWSQRLNFSRSCLRLPLHLAEHYYDRPMKSLEPIPGRPEFYDFELLEHREHSTPHDTPLKDLTLVVFDTETTGLEPSRGDEIISIAGVRIVNGRLLRGEIFANFVNPGRRIPPASTRIHGIDDEMVRDAEPIAVVLPRFHAFVGDAVLVAHNAAFDMKFLTLKQERAKVRFEQPVLDTVLLAAHLFPNAESLTLDTLAQRFNVSIADADRHTAVGDAMATARVLLRLMDLLPTVGVRTLGEALAASEKQVGLRRAQEVY